MLTSHPEIQSYKHRIINQIITAGAIMASIGLVGVFIRDYPETLGISFGVQSFFVLVSWVLALNLKRVALSVKVGYIVLTLYSVMLSAMLHLGYFAAAKLYVVLTPVIISFIYPYRVSLSFLAIFILTYLTIGYLHWNGYRIHSVEVMEHVSKSTVWITEGTILFLSAFLLLYVGYGYNSEIGRQLTFVKEKNEDLANAEKKYRRIFNATNDAIFIQDAKNGSILDVNESTLDMYGYTNKEELLGKNIQDLSAAEEGYDQKRVLKKILSVKNQSRIRFEWLAKKKDGENFWVEVSLHFTNILNNDRVIAAVRDIDDKKKKEVELKYHQSQLEKLILEKTMDLKKTNEELSEQHEIINNQNTELRATLQHLNETQAQLLQAEKMASLGILTAGLAHEINNPLNYIMGAYTGFKNLLDELGQEVAIDTRRKDILLRSLKTGVDRATEIVKGLNQFSRSTDAYDEECHIPSILNNCLAMLNNLIKNRIQVVKEFDPVVSNITGNVGKLHQVFINILTNAVHAIEGKGEITISSRADEKWLHIAIADTGTGIAKENIRRVTDPFFTTKEPGLGTGLGLSISYNIIRELGGDIKFESEAGKGTAVFVSLPIDNKL